MKVRHLSLHFNALEILPAGIGGCKELVWLSLNANRLQQLPEESSALEVSKRALVALAAQIEQPARRAS